MRESETNTPFEIYALSDSHFMFEDGMEYHFSKLSNGKKQVKFITDKEQIGTEIKRELPEGKKEIMLPKDVLKTYVGQYELQKDFIITITLEGDNLYAQATGQGKLQLFAESNTKFFLKAVPAQVEFKLINKTVNSLTLFQGGRQMPAKKIN